MMPCGLLPTEELSNKVFSNPVILENILRSKLYGFVSNDLDIRLVNRTFNIIALRAIRKNHRRIEIEFNDPHVYRSEHPPTIGCHVLSVYRKMEKIPEYFSFLNNVVKLKADEIIIKYIWKLKSEMAKQFHDDFIHSRLIGNNRQKIKTFTGLGTVCNGCTKCSDIAKSAQEYGPIGFDGLKRIDEPILFKKLVVTDELFDVIANKCSLESRKESFAALNSHISCMISCETLVIWINESRLGDGLTVDHWPMPLEVVEAMSERWNVKSIDICFINKCDWYKGKWRQNGHFTGVKLNSPFESNRVSSRKFHHVRVDMRESAYCANDIRLYNTEKNNGYENLIANIRRVFPTNEISIECLSLINPCCSTVQYCFKILEWVSKMDNPTNLNINIELFIRWAVWDDVPTELLEFPPQYSIEPEHLSCVCREMELNYVDRKPVFNNLKWIGRRLRLTENSFTLNLNTFIEPCLLEDKMPEKLQINAPFFEHFGKVLYS